MCRSCEDTLDGDMGGVDPYAWGVPMTMERGSMASLDSTLRKGPPGSWRQPELPEVIAMLNYRLDPVKTNAAAFLQHLTFKNDKVKHWSNKVKCTITEFNMFIFFNSGLDMSLIVFVYLYPG